MRTWHSARSAPERRRGCAARLTSGRETPWFWRRQLSRSSCPRGGVSGFDVYLAEAHADLQRYLEKNSGSFALLPSVGPRVSPARTDVSNLHRCLKVPIVPRERGHGCCPHRCICPPRASRCGPARIRRWRLFPGVRSSKHVLGAAGVVVSAALPRDGCACDLAPLIEARRDGRVGDRESSLLDRHLLVCGACRALAADLERLAGLAGGARVAPLSPLEQGRERLRLLRDAAFAPASAGGRRSRSRAQIVRFAAVAAVIFGVLGGGMALAVRGRPSVKAEPRTRAIAGAP
jgi:hypothetical protein